MAQSSSAARAQAAVLRDNETVRMKLRGVRTIMVATITGEGAKEKGKNREIVRVDIHRDDKDDEEDEMEELEESQISDEDECLDASEIVAEEEDADEYQEQPGDEESDHEVVVRQSRAGRARTEEPARSISNQREQDVTVVGRRENRRLDGTASGGSMAAQAAREVSASSAPCRPRMSIRVARAANEASADAPHASQSAARNVVRTTSETARVELGGIEGRGALQRPARKTPTVKWIKPDEFAPPAPLESYLSHFETIATYNQWDEYDKTANIKAALSTEAAQLLWDGGDHTRMTM